MCARAARSDSEAGGKGRVGRPKRKQSGRPVASEPGRGAGPKLGRLGRHRRAVGQIARLGRDKIVQTSKKAHLVFALVGDFVRATENIFFRESNNLRLGRT